MFYKLENTQLISHQDSPEVFGATAGIIPTQEQLEMFADYIWFDTETQAREYFGLPTEET